jgi:hypothetical protein
LVREAPDAHAEATTGQEALLQGKVEAVQEVKRVKEALAHQAEKEVNSLKKKLEAVGHTPRVIMQGRKKSRRRTPTRIPLYSY